MTFCYFSCLGRYCFWPTSMAALSSSALARWVQPKYILSAPSARISDFFDLCLHWVSVVRGLYYAPLRLCPIIGDVSSEARHLSLGHLLSFLHTVVRLYNLAKKIQALCLSFNQIATWLQSCPVIGCKLSRSLKFLSKRSKFIRWCDRKTANALGFSTY